MMRYSQRGNVVIFILLAVGLFGALAFTFTRGSQQGQGNMTEQQIKISGQEIIDYGNQLERVVDKLRSRGCSETQISFEHDPFDGSDTFYVNPNSPGDFSCHVFHANGGELSEPVIPDFAGPNAQYIYTADSAISGIGTANNDLFFAAYDINFAFCPFLNKLIWNFEGVNTPADNGTTGLDSFQGDLTINGVQILTSSGNPTNGQTAACIRGGTNIPTAYFYYKVLIAR